MSIINTQVQPFKVQAFHNGKFIEVTEQSLKGKWSVLARDQPGRRQGDVPADR